MKQFFFFAVIYQIIKFYRREYINSRQMEKIVKKMKKKMKMKKLEPMRKNMAVKMIKKMKMTREKRIRSVDMRLVW